MYDAFSTARGGRDIKAFKEALIGQIRSTLHNHRDAKLSEDLSGVFDIRFGFFNKEMLYHLRRRGEALAKANTKNISNFEAMMDKLK